MPHYRVKLTKAYEQSLESWKGDITDDIIRVLHERFVDILEHKSAFQRLRKVPEGYILSIDVELYSFLLFITYQDETFFVHDAVYNRDYASGREM